MGRCMSFQPGKTKVVSSVAFFPAFASFRKYFWYSAQPGHHLQMRYLVWITLKSTWFFCWWWCVFFLIDYGHLWKAIMTTAEWQWVLSVWAPRLPSCLSLVAITFSLTTAHPFLPIHHNMDCCYKDFYLSHITRAAASLFSCSLQSFLTVKKQTH